MKLQQQGSSKSSFIMTAISKQYYTNHIKTLFSKLHKKIYYKFVQYDDILWSQINNSEIRSGMEPEKTDYNSFRWRLWHSGTFVGAAIGFLCGSFLLFPYFATLWNNQLASAYFYTLGAISFILANCTQWIHYQRKIRCNQKYLWCQFPTLSFNYFLSVIGSIVYLTGAVFFLPSINRLEQGLQLFVMASGWIMIAQIWKVVRTIKNGYNNTKICQTLQDDFNQFVLDIALGVGAACYFVGSILFFNPSLKFQVIGAAVSSWGGFFFYLAGAFMINKYFLSNKKYEGVIKIASSQNKLQQTSQINVGQTQLQSK